MADKAVPGSGAVEVIGVPKPELPNEVSSINPLDRLRLRVQMEHQKEDTVDLPLDHQKLPVQQQEALVFAGIRTKMLIVSLIEKQGIKSEEAGQYTDLNQFLKRLEEVERSALIQLGIEDRRTIADLRALAQSTSSLNAFWTPLWGGLFQEGLKWSQEKIDKSGWSNKMSEFYEEHKTLCWGVGLAITAGIISYLWDKKKEGQLGGMVTKAGIGLGVVAGLGVAAYYGKKNLDGYLAKFGVAQDKLDQAREAAEKAKQGYDKAAGAVVTGVGAVRDVADAAKEAVDQPENRSLVAFDAPRDVLISLYCYNDRIYPPVAISNIHEAFSALKDYPVSKIVNLFELYKDKPEGEKKIPNQTDLITFPANIAPENIYTAFFIISSTFTAYSKLIGDGTVSTMTLAEFLGRIHKDAAYKMTEAVQSSLITALKEGTLEKLNLDALPAAIEDKEHTFLTDLASDFGISVEEGARTDFIVLALKLYNDASLLTDPQNIIAQAGSRNPKAIEAAKLFFTKLKARTIEVIIPGCVKRFNLTETRAPNNANLIKIHLISDKLTFKQALQLNVAARLIDFKKPAEGGDYMRELPLFYVVLSSLPVEVKNQYLGELPHLFLSQPTDIKLPSLACLQPYFTTMKNFAVQAAKDTAKTWFELASASMAERSPKEREAFIERMRHAEVIDFTSALGEEAIGGGLRIGKDLLETILQTGAVSLEELKNANGFDMLALFRSMGSLVFSTNKEDQHTGVAVLFGKYYYIKPWGIVQDAVSAWGQGKSDEHSGLVAGAMTYAVGAMPFVVFHGGVALAQARHAPALEMLAKVGIGGLRGLAAPITHPITGTVKGSWWMYRGGRYGKEAGQTVFNMSRDLVKYGITPLSHKANNVNIMMRDAQQMMYYFHQRSQVALGPLEHLERAKRSGAMATGRRVFMPEWNEHMLMKYARHFGDRYNKFFGHLEGTERLAIAKGNLVGDIEKIYHAAVRTESFFRELTISHADEYIRATTVEKMERLIRAVADQDDPFVKGDKLLARHEVETLLKKIQGKDGVSRFKSMMQDARGYLEGESKFDQLTRSAHEATPTPASKSTLADRIFGRRMEEFRAWRGPKLTHQDVLRLQMMTEVDEVKEFLHLRGLNVEVAEAERMLKAGDMRVLKYHLETAAARLGVNLKISPEVGRLGRMGRYGGELLRDSAAVLYGEVWGGLMEPKYQQAIEAFNQWRGVKFDYKDFMKLIELDDPAAIERFLATRRLTGVSTSDLARLASADDITQIEYILDEIAVVKKINMRFSPEIPRITRLCRALGRPFKALPAALHVELLEPMSGEYQAALEAFRQWKGVKFTHQDLLHLASLKDTNAVEQFLKVRHLTGVSLDDLHLLATTDDLGQLQGALEKVVAVKGMPVKFSPEVGRLMRLVRVISEPAKRVGEVVRDRVLSPSVQNLEKAMAAFDALRGVTKFSLQDVTAVAALKDQAGVKGFFAGKGITIPDEIAEDLAKTDDIEAIKQRIEALAKTMKLKIAISPEVSALVKNLKYLGRGLVYFGVGAGTLVSLGESAVSLYGAATTEVEGRAGILAAQGGMHALNTAVGAAYMLGFTGKTVSVGWLGGMGVSAGGAATAALMPIVYMGSAGFESALETTKTKEEWVEEYDHTRLIHEWISTRFDTFSAGEAYWSASRWATFRSDIDYVSGERIKTHQQILAAILYHEDRTSEPNPDRLLYLSRHPNPENYEQARELLHDSKDFMMLMALRRTQEQQGAKNHKLGTIDLMDQRFKRPMREDMHLMLSEWRGYAVASLNETYTQGFESLSDAYLIGLYEQARTDFSGRTDASEIQIDFLNQLNFYLRIVRKIDVEFVLNQRAIERAVKKEELKIDRFSLYADMNALIQGDSELALNCEKEHITDTAPCYALYTLARIHGYTGYQNEEQLRTFFTRTRKAALGIYWDGDEWCVNERGWELDNEMGSVLSEAVVRGMIKELRDDADNIFEHRQDAVVSDVDGPIDQIYAARAKKMADTLESALSEYRPLPEVEPKSNSSVTNPLVSSIEPSKEAAPESAPAMAA